MTAQIVQLRDRRMFPAPIDRGEHVANARAVLRSAEDHDTQTLSDACLVMQAWGDANDWIEADAMMLAIKLGARKRPLPPQSRPCITRADWIAALPGVAALVALFAACLWWPL